MIFLQVVSLWAPGAADRMGAAVLFFVGSDFGVVEFEKIVGLVVVEG